MHDAVLYHCPICNEERTEQGVILVPIDKDGNIEFIGCCTCNGRCLRKETVNGRVVLSPAP